jgi:chromosome segregation ATPase
MKSKLFLFLFCFSGCFGMQYFEYVKYYGFILPFCYSVALHFRIKTIEKENCFLRSKIEKITPDFIKDLELRTQDLGAKIDSLFKGYNEIGIKFNDFKNSLNVEYRKKIVCELSDNLKSLDFNYNKLLLEVNSLEKRFSSTANEIRNIRNDSIESVKVNAENAKNGVLNTGKQAEENLRNASRQNQNQINKLKDEIGVLSAKINSLSDQNQNFKNQISQLKYKQKSQISDSEKQEIVDGVVKKIEEKNNNFVNKNLPDLGYNYPKAPENK